VRIIARIVQDGDADPPIRVHCGWHISDVVRLQNVTASILSAAVAQMEIYSAAK